MEKESNTILDHIDRIIVEGNPFAEPANEFYALLCLRNGLAFLYNKAERCDKLALEQLDPKKSISVLVIPNF